MLACVQPGLAHQLVRSRLVDLDLLNPDVQSTKQCAAQDIAVAQILGLQLTLLG